MSKTILPRWADEMRSIFRSGTVSQFLIHGAIFDIVPYARPGGKTEFLGLKKFLETVMLQPFDIVVRYDRGTGIRATKGLQELTRFLKSYDEWNGTQYARSPAAIPRQPAVALSVLDRLLDWCAQHSAIQDGKLVRKPIRLAVIIDFVEFIAPQGQSLHVSGHYGDAVIRLLDWASDPALVEANALSILLTENLSDLHASVQSNPYSAKLQLSLPSLPELESFTRDLLDQDPSLKKALTMERPAIIEVPMGDVPSPWPFLMLPKVRGA